ncbi:MAG TPA: hypothetical protein VN461_22820 [Vicinamibacteria bacterium]|nr:hypothetical protein [Vicinamibacteria bacterium]
MRPRLWSALLSVGLFGAIVSVFLISSSARLPLKTPFVTKTERGRPLLAPLVRTAGRAGAPHYQLGLFLASVTTLLEHPEIQLFFSTGSGNTPRVRAELQVVGTPCRYTTEAGATLADGEPLPLLRGPECTPSPRQPTGRLELDVEYEGGADLSIWAFPPLPDVPAPGAFRISASTPVGEAPLLRGFFIDYPPTAPRIRLLNYMWQVSPSPLWLWLLLSLAAALGVGGILVFPMHPSPPEAGQVPIRRALLGGLGASFLAGALGLTYAVLVPPLSGPDEPYHLFGFAELNEEAGLPSGIVQWMSVTHFQRIRAHPTERFRAMDIGHPLDLEDPEFKATEVAMRSASTARLWRAAGGLLHDQTAPRTLLVVRLLNASLFAFMVGLGTSLAVGCSAAPYPQLVCLPFLFVPALPFFAMHFSETALLTSTYVLLASSLAVLFLDGPRAHAAGFSLGLSTALMLAGGRSPWPLVAVVAMALGARVLLGSLRERGEVWAAGVFWAGFALGSGTFYHILSKVYRPMLLQFTAYAPAGLRPVAVWLVEHPWGIAGLAALAGAAEVGFARLRRALPQAWARPAGTVVRWAALALAVAVGLSLLGSLFLSYPQLELEPLQPLSRPAFTTRILATMATMFRLRDPNFLLHSTFWAGFGWLDTLPDATFLSTLALLTAACLITLLLHLARHRDIRRFFWLLALGLGSALALVIYALSIYGLPMALQGRYLIGWYLPVLSVIGCGVVLAEPPKARSAQHPVAIPDRISRPAVLLALCGLVHAYCLCFILGRYF